MGEKIVIGPINKGMQRNKTAFAIDNDAFPTLVNAYQWRGRIKRKRGTSPLTRLERSLQTGTVLSVTTDGTTTYHVEDIFEDSSFGLRSTQNLAQIVPTTVTITVGGGGGTYVDTAGDAILLSVDGSGTINYNTGELDITFNVAPPAASTVTVQINYYPSLPVMGLEDFYSPDLDFPATLGFDTTYAYNINTNSPYRSYDVSYYKNVATATYTGYTRKTTTSPLVWNGQDYQQFWTVNYQGALWACNGVTDPFSISNVGMQFRTISNISMVVLGPPATARLTITGHGLAIGDFLFINEVSGFTAANDINFQTCFVTAVPDVNNVDVTFPNTTLVGAYTSGGIAQYLTATADATKDCIRWYDGDPTDANVITPTLSGVKGWVNFCPPLSKSNLSIADAPAGQYYLVGAKMIVPFKDRLLFIGPVIQTSSNGSQIYLQDTVVYSQNGTPYYTASFTGNPSLANTTYQSILVPTNQTATPNSYWGDQTGYGGWISAGLDQPINTAAANEDALILGLTTYQTRFVYTSNDIIPFNFLLINAELGSSSTFSAITMDRGILSKGSRGFVMSSQNAVERFDLDIPDQVFRINTLDNGNERICAQRDYINEWIDFTYPANNSTYKYPNQTLQYNYRDNSWAVHKECYTTYGIFRKRSGLTWATVGDVYETWSVWNDPWNAGVSTVNTPEIIGGNQQGFVVSKGIGTGEADSLTIKNISFPATITGATQANPCVLTCTSAFIPGQTVTISGVVGMTELNGNTYTISAVTPTTVTLSVNSTGFTAYSSGGTATPNETVFSPNHCLNPGDFIVINDALGTIGAAVNGKVFSVQTPNNNGFRLDGDAPTSGTYLGNGHVKRMYIPSIKTRQFPMAWEMARKTRLGPQQYLLSMTPNSQITLLIYLSQNNNDPYNDGPIIPDASSLNDGLIYSTVLYTCTESSNLGLTPAQTNLQMISDIDSSGTSATSPQKQIWHRVNTSLIGDTVQLGFTLSEAQMTDPTLTHQFAEIELHSFILDASPSSMLS